MNPLYRRPHVYVAVISTLTLMFTLPREAVAQNAMPSVQLDEVEIQAARVIQKPDGMQLYPSSVQKESASSGFSLLQKLALPNLRINELTGEVSAFDQKGSVQLRINGIVADKTALQALNPEDVRHIDFIDNPGVRYGEGVAYVIAIVTRRPDSGYSAGADLMQSVTTRTGNYQGFGKWNRQRSEWSIHYGFDYRDFRRGRMEERTCYELTDGSFHTINRKDETSRSKGLNHHLKLAYNLTDSTKLVFQATLSGDFSKQPGQDNRKLVSGGSENYIALKREERQSTNPVADLYFFYQFTPRQSVTANVVGTAIATRSSFSDTEGAPYAYQVDGKTGSLMGEVIYENRFSLFTLSAGLNYRYKYTHNEYSGDSEATNRIHHQRTYGFAELKGTWGKWTGSAGLGLSGICYRQGEHEYDYRTWCPKVAVGYQFMEGLHLNYYCQSNERVSQIAMISEAAIRQNSLEWTVGSPNLKPNRDWMQQVRLSYHQSRWQSFALVSYKICKHPNMASYVRTDDNRFLYTQCNQKEIDALQAMVYINYWLIPDRLSMAASGGLFRCFNYGDEYTHCYTSYPCMASLEAYLGRWSLSAYADNGWRFLEGETRGYNGAEVTLKVGYRINDWNLSLYWESPFMGRYKMFESEIMNRYLHKQATYYSRDSGNRLSLKVSWQLHRGRKFRTAPRNLQLRDKDTGIIR